MSTGTVGIPFASVVINAPRSEVWKVLTDIQKWKNVISGIDDLVITQGGPKLEPGVAWDETRVMFGRSETEHMEIVEIDESQYLIKSKSESCGMLMEFEHRIEGVRSSDGRDSNEEDACILELYHASKALTWTAWAFSWIGILTRGMVRKVILQDLNDIKAAVEK